MRGPLRTLPVDPGERPFLVIWEVTRACALACAHCRAEAVPHRDPFELTTEEGKALLDDLAAYPAPRPIVVLTGGDPFERPDLAELVAHGTARGLHVSLSPSVTPRLTPEVLGTLRAAGAGAVSLSLDGAAPETHDAFRGIDGTFAATLEAAAAVRRAGLRLQVNTTATAANVGELPAVLGLAAELGASLWSVFLLVGTGRGRALDALDPDHVEDLLHWLHEVSPTLPVKATEAPHFRRIALQRAASGNVERDFPPGLLRRALRAGTPALPPPRRSGGRPPLDVNAGKGFAFVDHHGEVQPSGFLPVSAGSVRDRPFSAIYREAPLLRALRDPDGFGGRCGACEFRQVCGGSRSRAYAVTGDPLAEDPACAHVPTGRAVAAAP
jgi:radical SAM protein